MSDGRFAILDPAAGISGDMLLGALIAAGAPPAWLQGLPARLGHPDVTVDVAETDRASIRCIKVTVRLPDGSSEAPYDIVAEPRGHGHVEPHGPATDHGAAHTHAHHGPHRHIGQLIRAVEAADLSEWVRTRAVQAFRLLGEAEGRVHGVPAEDVSLHEVGAVDALVDIVGGIEGFEVLGLRTVYNRPVAVGSGWVRAAHGVMAVPAPATGLLLEGLQIGPDGPVTGEATTPTGAVLLRVLTSGPPPDSWRPVRSSWGAGGRNPAEYANALRMIVAERAPEAGEVVLMATDVDDLSPEYLEPLRSAMFDAGALDVQIWATQMKKGRTGFRVEATMAPADADRVAAAVLRHSTSAGLRRWRGERTTLQRETIEVAAGDGSTVRVKLVHGPDGVRAKPEFDDVVEVARRTGRAAHEVASELHLQALRQADVRLVGGPETPNTSHKE